jgi:hypothetical protein
MTVINVSENPDRTENEKGAVSLEMMVMFSLTTQHHIPEKCDHIHHHWNMKFHLKLCHENGSKKRVKLSP